MEEELSGEVVGCVGQWLVVVPAVEERLVAVGDGGDVVGGVGDVVGVGGFGGVGGEDVEVVGGVEV
ncbi:hypothetical protein, partial [Saccharothrix stipae]